MSKLIKAFVRVPSGPYCHFENNLTCDYLARCSFTKTHYCSVFHDVKLASEITGSSGRTVFLKCDACLKACEEATND